MEQTELTIKEAIAMLLCNGDLDARNHWWRTSANVIFDDTPLSKRNWPCDGHKRRAKLLIEGLENMGFTCQ